MKTEAAREEITNPQFFLQKSAATRGKADSCWANAENDGRLMEKQGNDSVSSIISIVGSYASSSSFNNVSAAVDQTEHHQDKHLFTLAEWQIMYIKIKTGAVYISMILNAAAQELIWLNILA